MIGHRVRVGAAFRNARVAIRRAFHNIIITNLGVTRNGYERPIPRFLGHSPVARQHSLEFPLLVIVIPLAIAMLGRTVFAAVTAATAVLCAPVKKRADIDPVILNFALTLEHLENAFYKGAIQRFSLQDFTAAGKHSLVQPRCVR